MPEMLTFAPAFASPEGGEAIGAVRAIALARLNGTRRRIAAALDGSGQTESGAVTLWHLPGSRERHGGLRRAWLCSFCEARRRRKHRICRWRRLQWRPPAPAWAARDPEDSN